MFISLLAFQGAHAMKRKNEDNANRPPEKEQKIEESQKKLPFEDEANQLDLGYINELDKIYEKFLASVIAIPNGHHLRLATNAGAKLDEYFHLEPPEFQKLWKNFLGKMRISGPDTRVFCTKKHQIVLDLKTASRKNLANRKIMIMAEPKTSSKLVLICEFYLNDLNVHTTEIDPQNSKPINVSVVCNVSQKMREEYKDDSYLATLYTNKEIVETLLRNITTCFEDNIYILLCSEYFCGIHPRELVLEKMQQLSASNEERLYASLSVWEGNLYWFEMAKQGEQHIILEKKVALMKPGYSDTEVFPGWDFENLAEGASARGLGYFEMDTIYTDPFVERLE